jgi:hypothetical protein
MTTLSIVMHRISLIPSGCLGGEVRSVRASVGRWMPERPCAGNFSAFLEFEDGTPATISYNGHGYFDTAELTWGIGNRMYDEAERVAVRRELRQGRCCQAKANLSPIGSVVPNSGRQFTPFGICRRTGYSKFGPACEMTVVIEMVEDRSVGGSEFLQGLDVPELRHRTFTSSKRLV